MGRSRYEKKKPNLKEEIEWFKCPGNSYSGKKCGQKHNTHDIGRNVQNVVAQLSALAGSINSVKEDEYEC